MMRFESLMLPFLAALLLFSGCTAGPRPAIISVALNECGGDPGPFPARPWVSVHRISAKTGLGGFSTLIGVTRGDPGKRRLHSVLLTAEGFVLFEAELGDEGFSNPIRAVPPFDSPAFAAGFVKDVRSIFLPPPGSPAEAGRTREGAALCRWHGQDGSLVEILTTAGEWKLSSWDDRGRMGRTVLFSPPLVKGLPSMVELKVPGPGGYSLHLELLRAD
jgi:hypothetical protein